MSSIEFVSREIPLEYYLDVAVSKVLEDSSNLTNILDTIDPRKQVTHSLPNRLHPLTAIDMVNLKRLAFIKPIKTLETISSNKNTDGKFYVGGSLNWYEVYGDYVNPIEVKEINLHLTTIKLENWQLLCLFSKTIGSYLNKPEEKFDYNIGWIHDSELEELRQLATAS